MKSQVESFLVPKSALCSSEPITQSAGAIQDGSAIMVVPEASLTHAQRQLEDAQQQLTDMATLLKELVATHEKRLEHEDYRKFTKKELAQIKTALEGAEGCLHQEQSEAARLELELIEAKSNLHEAQMSAVLAERERVRSEADAGHLMSVAMNLLKVPGYQLNAAEAKLPHPLITELLGLRIKYVRATGLISKLMTVHHHVPVFAEEDEMNAEELANEFFRHTWGLEGKPLPQLLVDRQQDTINALRKLCSEKESENKRIRHYEGEWKFLLDGETEEKELARNLLRSMSNRMGYEDFGPLCKEIDQFLDQAKARDKARENQPSDHTVRTLTFKATEQGNAGKN